MRNKQWMDHLILILGVLFMLTPIWRVFANSTHSPNDILTHCSPWVNMSLGL